MCMCFYLPLNSKLGMMILVTESMYLLISPFLVENESESTHNLTSSASGVFVSRDSFVLTSIYFKVTLLQILIFNFL